MAAERGRDEVIACARRERAALRPVRAVVAQLNLILGVPACIVADDGDERETAAHGGVELGHVKPEAAVAEDGDDRRVRARRLGRNRKRDRGADGAGRPVDQPIRRANDRLGPLPDLAAIADEHRVGGSRQPVVDLAAQLGGMDGRIRHASARARHDGGR